MIPLAAVAASLLLPLASSAADIVRTPYASRQAVVAERLECSLIRVAQPRGERVVRVCNPPLDLNPRRRPVAGASAGTTESSIAPYATQRQ
jgi:hypothetical protein